MVESIYHVFIYALQAHAAIENTLTS